MAITNAQQYKQLQLVKPRKDGKRPGYYGADAGFGDDDYKDASASFDAGSGSGGSDADFARARSAIDNRAAQEAARIEKERFEREKRNLEINQKQRLQQKQNFAEKFRIAGLKNLYDQKIGEKKAIPSFGNILSTFDPALNVYERSDPAVDQYGMSGKDLTDVDRLADAINKGESTGDISQTEFEEAFYGPEGPPKTKANDTSDPFIPIIPNTIADKTGIMDQEESELAKMMSNRTAYRFMANGGMMASAVGDESDDISRQLFGKPVKNLTPDEFKELQEEIERLMNKFRASKGGIASMADGGIMNNDVVGGEMDFDSARQMYGLGKLVKKVTRSVKKIAKSPIGKAALLGAVGFGIPGTSFGGLLGRASFGGAAPGIFGTFGPTSALKKLGIMKSVGDANMAATKTGPFAKLGIGSAILGTSLAAGFLTKDQEEEAQAIADETGIDIAEIRANPNKYLATRFKAEGGLMRTKYAEGSKDLEKNPEYKGWKKMYENNPDVGAMHENHKQYLNFYERNKNKQAEGSKEPVAKETMPLLDMDGMEKDYREDGGFVPIGRMEKADDVPARLSKNEFVFTADAVRNAGDGNVDKGAEVMYNMMKNLESGGDVSEESQGLEGARKMFQTSQRLEEVI